jgi:hypothetical protein
MQLTIDGLVEKTERLGRELDEALAKLDDRERRLEELNMRSD